MIKRLFCLLLTVIVFSSAFTLIASAETYTLSDDIKITLPDDFIILTDNNLKANEEIITSLGHSLTSLRNYMDENHVLFIAMDSQNENQAQLAAFKTEFSKDIGDLDGLKAYELEKIGNQMLGGNFEIIAINGWIYFETKVDGLAGYATVQYITFKNGMLYTLNYYGSDRAVANAIASGLDLPQKSSGASARSILLSILLWVALVAALVTMVLLIISFVSDFRKNKEDNDVREYIRIKRHRRF